MDVEQFTEKAVKIFRDCSRVPTTVAARILPVEGEGRYEIEARWSQREIERGKKLAYSKSYFVEKKGTKVDELCATTFQADATKVVKVAYASKCSVKAILVKDKQAKAEESSKAQQYIEVWNGSVLTKTIAVEDLKKHGTINEDIYFGSFQLSPDGKQLLYIAEKKKPKPVSFFNKQEPATKEDTPVTKGAEYVYEKSWGEQLSKVVNPLPVVLTLETEECDVIDTAKFGDISGGQAQWIPGDEGGVIFAGWENHPIKQGFIYCLNRRSALYYVNIKTNEYVKLTDSKSCVFNPRFNLQGNKMVYFEAEAGGPHHTCAALKMMEWPSRNISTVTDIVMRPKSPDEFPGFYAVFHPERCWSASGDKVIFSDNWASFVEVNCVDVTKKSVTRISGTENKGAWSVLDVSHDLIVAQFASLTTSPQLFIGVVPDSPTDSVAWTQIAATQTTLTDGMNWDVTTYNTDDGLYYQSILLTPPPPSTATPIPRPLAVFPHGGPHVVYPVDFMVWPVCLAALGFTVLIVNYRGSAGFGQDNVKSLPGKAGTQDVRDVQDAAEAVVKTGVVDKDRVVVLGGSHGGFLSAHLVGQFPDFYKATSIRNPVIDMSSMSATSDIPLWCFVESGANNYDPANPRVTESLDTMLKCSPIMFVDKIKAPVILHLGTDDLRCPNQQGLLLYNTLKAQNKEVKALMYPGESHPINSVYSDADSFVNTAEWLYRYSCL